MTIMLAQPAVSGEPYWMYDSSAKTLAHYDADGNADGLALANVNADTSVDGNYLEIGSQSENAALTDADIDFTERIVDSTDAEYAVYRLCRGSFYGCSGIKSLKAGDSLRYIDDSSQNGDGAFRGSSISNFVAGAALEKIGYRAFQGSSLEMMDLSAATNLTTMGTAAFQDCTNLTGTVVVPDTVTTFGTWMFSGAGVNSATGFSVVFGASAVPTKVDRVSGNYGGMFYGSGVVLVDFSALTKLASIDDKAFLGCTKLSEVRLPESLTTCPKYAFDKHRQEYPHLSVYFMSCPISDVTETPFAEMYNNNKQDYEVTDEDITNSNVTAYIPYPSEYTDSVWTVAAGAWATLSSNSPVWKTDSSQKVFSLPDDVDGEGLWVTDWKKTRSTWSDAAVVLRFWQDERATNRYTITYILDGGVNDEGNPSDYTYYDTVALAAPTLEGRSFLCWQDETGLALSKISYGSTGDKVLTAIWQDPGNWLYDSAEGTLSNTVSHAYITNVENNSGLLSVLGGSSSSCIEPQYGILDFTEDIVDKNDASVHYDLVRVDNGAFSGWNVVEARFPDTLLDLGSAVFENCQNLVSVSFGSGVTNIGERAFVCAQEIESVDLTSSPNLASIGACAFSNCASLVSVDASALKSLAVVGDGAFSGCAALLSASFDGCTSLACLGSDAFLDCVALADADFSGSTSLSRIGDNAFSGCVVLPSVDFSGCTLLESIGKGMCMGCSALASASFSGCASLTNLAGYAFYNCIKLTDADFSGCEAMERVGEHAYHGCTSLTNADFSGCTSVSSVDDYAFYGCSVLAEVDFSDGPGVTNAGKKAFNGCGALVSVRGCALQTVGEEAFYYCRSLVDLGPLTNLVSVAFRGLCECRILTNEVDLLHVTHLGETAFGNCWKLPFGDVMLVDAGLTTIGVGAFSSCVGITSVTIGTNVTTISKKAFHRTYACSKVQFLGDTVNTIGDAAFGAHGERATLAKDTVNFDTNEIAQLSVYFRNLPASFGACFKETHSKDADDGPSQSEIDTTNTFITAYIPYNITGASSKHAFYDYALAWQATNNTDIAGDGGMFSLPSDECSFGIWYNSSTNWSGYVVRLAYYPDPELTRGFSINIR